MKTYADLIKLIESKGFTNEEAVSFVKIEKNMKGNAGAADSAECGDDVYKFYESRTMVENIYFYFFHNDEMLYILFYIGCKVFRLFILYVYFISLSS